MCGGLEKTIALGYGWPFVGRLRNILTNRPVIALAMMFRASHCASPIHPFMGVRILNPRVRILRGIQDDITMYGRCPHTLQPQLLLLAVKVIKLAITGRLEFVLQKLSAHQAVALMRAAEAAE
jgi:hypothetical protein